VRELKGGEGSVWGNSGKMVVKETEGHDEMNAKLPSFSNASALLW
jgi:hypothetical protein